MNQCTALHRQYDPSPSLFSFRPSLTPSHSFCALRIGGCSLPPPPLLLISLHSFPLSVPRAPASLLHGSAVSDTGCARAYSLVSLSLALRGRVQHAACGFKLKNRERKRRKKKEKKAGSRLLLTRWVRPLSVQEESFSSLCFTCLGVFEVIKSWRPFVTPGALQAVEASEVEWYFRSGVIIQRWSAALSWFFFSVSGL